MRRFMLVMLSGLVTLSLAGCWKQIESESWSDYKLTDESYYVIKDQATWSFLYHWTHVSYLSSPNNGVPNIDFSKDVALAAYLGRKNVTGHAIEFADITYAPRSSGTGERLSVHVVETAATPQAGVEYPYAFARAKMGAQDTIQFRKAGFHVSHQNLTWQPLAEQDLAPRVLSDPVSGSHVLETGVCPNGGAAVVSGWVDYPANGLTNVYFCPSHGRYWLRVDDLFVGTTNWFGPFTPGKF